MLKKIAIIFFIVLSQGYGRAQSHTLQYYIDIALQNSPLLQDIRNQQTQNKYDSLLIRATLKPQVNASSMNMMAPVIKGWGYDAAITNGQVFAELVGVSKSLPNKKTIAAQMNSLQLQNESLSNTSHLSEQDLRRSICAQYITAYSALQQVRFDEELMKILDKEDILLKKQTQNNTYKQVDYLSFLVSKQQQEFIWKQAQIQYKNELSTLNSLCGIVSEVFDDSLSKPDIRIKPFVDEDHSIFYKQFVIDSLKLQNNRAILDGNYRPKVNVFADAGYNSSITYKAYKNIGTSLGVGVSIPIYDGKQKQIQQSKINIAQQTQVHYKEFFAHQYKQQIIQLMQQLSATEKLIDEMKGQLKYPESLIEANVKLLEVGEVRITDYLLSINSYINTKNLILQNEMSRLQIINQLNYWNK